MSERLYLPRINKKLLERIITLISENPTEEFDGDDVRLYMSELLNYERQINATVTDLEARVLIDSLTKAYNRRKFDIDIVKLVKEVDLSYSFLENSTEKNYVSRKEAMLEKDLCMLLVDLDHFKSVNDTYGHQKGDEVLILSVGAIESSIREGDNTTKVYRYGGEEFAVLVPKSNLDVGVNIANRVLESIRDTVILEKGKPVTASIGVSNYRGNCSSIEDLIRNSDRALYRAKDAGRNRVEIYKS